MLVLSRKHGEAVRIHDQVTVTVLAIRGNRVQLGIQAPDDVSVQRSELPRQPASTRRGDERAFEIAVAHTA